MYWCDKRPMKCTTRTGSEPCQNTAEHLDNVLFLAEEIFSPLQMGMPEAIASLQYFESNPLRIAHIPSSQRKKYAFDAINIILDLWQEVSG